MIKWMHFLTCLVSLILCGCADNYHLQVTGGEQAKLDADKSVYISLSNDGAYDNVTCFGSGELVSRLLQAEFLQHCKTAHTAAIHQDNGQTLDYAKQKEYGYLVLPAIIHWQDRPSNASTDGKRVEVKIEVVDLSSGNTVTTALITDKDVFTVFAGDTPLDIVREPLKQFVQGLY